MDNHFKRKEKKYVLNRDTAESIKCIAENISKDAAKDDLFRYTDIKTIYLDNENYLIYHIKKNKSKVRYKIRLREYSRNGKYDEYIWVELKEKIDKISYKSRFKIKKKHIYRFLSGENVLRKVLKVNRRQKRSQLAFLYSKIQRLIIDYDLKPTFAVEYFRSAYEKGLKDGLRLTFDSNLRSYKVDRNNLFVKPANVTYYDENKNILEIKSINRLPVWLKTAKKDNNIKREKFSKFVFGSESQFSINNTVPAEVYNSYISVGDKEFVSNPRNTIKTIRALMVNE